MKIIKKITAVVLAAATVGTLSITAMAYYSSDSRDIDPYGTLNGDTTVTYTSGYVYFTAKSSATQTTPLIVTGIKVTNTSTGSVVYNRLDNVNDRVSKPNTELVICESPGYKNSDNYTALSIHEAYEYGGKRLARFYTLVNS